MGPPGWIVGPAVAVGTLFFFWGTPLAAIGIFGLILPAAIAMWAGAAAAELVDSHRFLNTTLVVITTVAVLLGYMAMLQSQPPPPGAAYGATSMPEPPGAAKSGFSVPPP
jgi:hypothetical protein